MWQVAVILDSAKLGVSRALESVVWVPVSWATLLSEDLFGESLPNRAPSQLSPGPGAIHAGHCNPPFMPLSLPLFLKSL